MIDAKTVFFKVKHPLLAWLFRHLTILRQEELLRCSCWHFLLIENHQLIQVLDEVVYEL